MLLTTLSFKKLESSKKYNLRTRMNKLSALLNSKSGKIIHTYAIMFVGLFLYALGYTLFLIPAEITGGGITGVGTAIFYVTGFKVGYSYFIINIFLIILGTKILGKGFGIKTVINMTMVAFVLTILQEYITEPVIEDLFLSSVLGAMICGVGLGMVFTQGGSTGGTDIIAMILTKYNPNLSPGRVILYCDVIIISSSWFIFKDPGKLVYGFVSMWAVSYSIDAFLNGQKQSTQMFIFSKKWEKIRDYIIHDTDRGATILDGEGGYTGDSVKIVMSVVRKREATSIFKKVKEIDPNAFISMGSVMGVYGQGFEKLSD